MKLSKFSIFNSICLLLANVCYVQGEITIRLTDRISSTPFDYARNLGRPLDDSTRIFKIAQKTYIKHVVRQLDLLGNPKDRPYFLGDNSEIEKKKLKASLFYLIGIDSFSNITFVADTNFDNDFTNDNSYSLSKPTNSKEENIDFSFPLLHIVATDSDFWPSLDVKIIPKWNFPNLKINTGDQFLDSTLVAFESIKHKFGIFQGRKKKIFVYVDNLFPSLRYNHQYLTRIMLSDTLINNPIKDKQNFATIGGTILIDSVTYRINSVSPLGDQISFSEVLEVDLKQEALRLFIGKNDVGKNEKIRADQISGKYILIDFWGTWCVPCIALTDSIKSLHRLVVIPNKDKLELVSVALDKSDAVVKAYLVRKNIMWPNIVERLNNADQQEIISHFKINSYPTFLLLDPYGKVVAKEVGEEGLKKITASIKEKFSL